VNFRVYYAILVLLRVGGRTKTGPKNRCFRPPKLSPLSGQISVLYPCQNGRGQRLTVHGHGRLGRCKSELAICRMERDRGGSDGFSTRSGCGPNPEARPLRPVSAFASHS
jgi:hypothetical protein